MTVEVQSQPETHQHELTKTQPASSRLRYFVDHIATAIIKFGGITVIICIAGLLLLFLSEILPLWQSAKIERRSQVLVPELVGKTSAKALAIGSDEYQQIGYVMTEDGLLQFFELDSKQPLTRSQLPLAPGVVLTCIWFEGKTERFAAGTNSGEVIIGQLDYQTRFEGSRRASKPTVEIITTIVLDSTAHAVTAVAGSGSPAENLFVAGVMQDGRLLLYQRQIKSSMFGDDEIQEYRTELQDLGGTPTALVIDKAQANFYVGLRNGTLLHYRVGSEGRPQPTGEWQAGSSAITQLGLLIGDRSLVVTDQHGHIEVWSECFDPDGTGSRSLKRIHQLRGHDTGVTAFSASQRNRTFLTGSDGGELLLQFSTTQRTLYRTHFSEHTIRTVSICPKGDGALVLDDQQLLTHLTIDSPHPEVSWRAYFGKIWYEGYNRPEYVWQSSSGTDDFEAKLSLVPLLFGTIKGTIYALMFALPIGVMTAVFVSQFMHPNLRKIIKPTMEIMAALPSVVLGFIAGLWLAPRVQPVVPGLLAMFLLIPAIVLLFGWLWQRLPKAWLGRLRPGIESFALIPVIVVAGWLLLQFNGSIEAWFFDGDFRKWLIETMGLNYDQRNAFVVGLIMGFAVIPIIFTISEDALSNVPKSLVAASLALGATQWQTALRVVLPSASPGIFSATMIGLGRAIGETMIVLMATGNTPVLEWNIFNGFRTLSANIAVEIPEAPEGGTLFRTLFLAALLLFLLTAILNTLAEIVRQRMRRKFSSA